MRGSDAQEEETVTYMPADNLRDRQQQIDQRFHEYKLAALTGILHAWGPHKFNGNDADKIAVACDLVARAMERMDLAERGTGP